MGDSDAFSYSHQGLLRPIETIPKACQEAAMKLRRNEYCPIHRSTFCCGREQLRRKRRLRLGVQRIEDPHHPRGYRELRSPAEMRKLLKRKVAEQHRICAICHQEFTDYNDVVPDHRDPKGMGGAWRDDHTRTIFKQRIGGATEKKDRAEPSRRCRVRWESSPLERFAPLTADQPSGPPSVRVR